MSIVLHNKTIGYYTPSFFYMEVGTNSSFKKFDDRDFSVFLHEYIHFIQDITTLYGLNNMYVYSEYVRHATNKIYKLPHGLFNVPILPSIENEDNVYLNKQICNLTNGGDDFDISKIKKINSIEILVEQTGVVGSPITDIETVVVHCIDINDIDYILAFGAKCIMENMAYIMEQMVCENYASSADYPYSFAEKIVDKIYPEFGVDKLNVLALCDLSLQYSNPGEVFYQFLQEMASIQWKPTQPEDIYDEIYSRINVMNNQNEILLNDNFIGLFNNVKTQIKGYFNDPLLFKEIVNWVDQTFDSALNLRLKNRYFILDVARGGNIKTNVAFNDLFSQVGTPLISNNTGEFTVLNPNNTKGVDLDFFSAIGQIVSVFEFANFKCRLYPLCLKQNIEVGNHCHTAPWLGGRGCTFALFWKHWKLKNYIPTIDFNK